MTDPSLDAMIAAADHHEVLFENEHVRVLDTRLRPGDSTPVHTHAWPAALYVTSWSDVVRTDQDGNVLLDSRARGMNPANGSAIWGPALGPHSVKNVGDAELRVLAVELKQGAT